MFEVPSVRFGSENEFHEVIQFSLLHLPGQAITITVSLYLTGDCDYIYIYTVTMYSHYIQSL